MAAPLIPADLNAQLRSWAPNGKVTPLETTVGGFSNLSFTAKVANELCVVKAASSDLKRDDIRREATVLGRLTETEPDFPIPEVMVMLEGNWTVLITRFVEGANALTNRPTPAGVRIRAELLGRLLSTVHACTIAPHSGGREPGLDVSERTRWAIAALEKESFDPEVTASLAAALSHHALQRGVSLIHGDFGLHNVLWASSGRSVKVAVLLDWEWAGWGNPLTDVAWLWWTFQHRALSPDAWNSFLTGYGPWAVRAMGWDTDTARALVRAQMGQLLLRTAPGSGPREEWLNRLAALDGYEVGSI